MSHPHQLNIETKRMEKLTKYRQLAFKMHKKLGGGIKKAMVITTRTVVQKQTILMDSESLIH